MRRLQNRSQTESLSTILREQLKDDPEFKRTGGIFTPYILRRHFAHKLPPEFSHIPKSGPTTFLRTVGDNPKSIHLPGIGRQLHPSRDDIAILTDTDLPPLKRAGLIFGIQYGDYSEEQSIVDLADSTLDKSHVVKMEILAEKISTAEVTGPAIFFNVFEPYNIYFHQGSTAIKTLFSEHYHCLAFAINPTGSQCDIARACHWQIFTHQSHRLYCFAITDKVRQRSIPLTYSVALNG